MFYNATNIIGASIEGATNNLTGSESFTLLIVFVIFLAVLLALRMPPVIAMAISSPLLLVLVAYSSTMRLVAGIILFILAVIMARMWFWD